jgi:YgiT-type zinc finger domain-containing protein
MAAKKNVTPNEMATCPFCGHEHQETEVERSYSEDSKTVHRVEVWCSKCGKKYVIFLKKK